MTTVEGLNVGRVESAQLAGYLHQQAQDGMISQQTMSRALEAWELLCAAAEDLSAPDAAPGPDGQVLYTWDRDRYHLELEIFPEGPAEFFYRDRHTGSLWECDFDLSAAVPEEALERLNLFHLPA